jgi:two-component system, sensor histidine kinase and response regulator
MNELHNQKRECILVVDDSIDNLYLMQFVLESQGYTVGLADNGQEALSKIKRSQPDLILLDVMMPQMDGYELVHRLREDKNIPFIPVFLVTADKYTDWTKAIAAGANGIIYKPIDIDELLSQVKLSLKTKNDDF